MTVPSVHVGSDAYLERLATAVDERGFPRPHPALVPELATARHVASAARAAGDDAFADRVDGVRDPVLAPLSAFDGAVRARESGDGAVDDGTADEGATDDGTASEALRDRLGDRELTFLDYPAPPHHLVEAAADRGEDLVAPAAAAPGYDPDWATAFEERRTVAAVAAGARAVAREAVESGFPIEDPPSGSVYESPARYAGTVAFNAALAAESMLERGGDLVTPP